MSGPGSRGGRWHDPGHRAAYYRAWRASRPDYRERERLRAARARAVRAGRDPGAIVVPSGFPRPLPEAGRFCGCDCGCRLEVAVVCGPCREGLHHE